VLAMEKMSVGPEGTDQQVLRENLISNKGPYGVAK